jgi:hypothetical protein
MVTLINKTNQKNHVYFIPHAFSENILVNAHILVKLNLLKSHDL